MSLNYFLNFFLKEVSGFVKTPLMEIFLVSPSISIRGVFVYREEGVEYTREAYFTIP